ncbi:MAG: RloB family protein [Clostridiales bacterium]|nr:RloB family protein [Clostridiales bacterium]
MSLKPKKKSELKKIEEKMKAKESKMDTKKMLPPYTMIVSEGVKTEPNYLRGFVSKINAKYKDITKENHIEVYGTGRNTQSLIRFVDKKIARGVWKKYQKFWLVYDKDDFPLDSFDNTQFEAEARKDVCMATAWSNESVELWFLLHFQNYASDNGREQYIEILNKYFDYSKVREDLYDKLMELGSVNNAKKRARNAYMECIESGITAPSAMVPVTRMFELVEELETYLDD